MLGQQLLLVERLPLVDRRPDLGVIVHAGVAVQVVGRHAADPGEHLLADLPVAPVQRGPLGGDPVELLLEARPGRATSSARPLASCLIRSIRPGSPAVIASIRRSIRAWMRSRQWVFSATVRLAMRWSLPG